MKTLKMFTASLLLIILLGAGCTNQPLDADTQLIQEQPEKIPAEQNNQTPLPPQNEEATFSSSSDDTSELKTLKEWVEDVEKYQNTPEYQIQLRDEDRINQLKFIQSALEMYYSDNNKYPEGTNIIIGSKGFTCLNNKGWQKSGCANYYMQEFAGDPSAGRAFIYSSHYDQKAKDSTYTVTARLEGTSTPTAQLEGTKVTSFYLHDFIVLTPSGIAQK